MNISKRILRFGVAALAMAIGSQALAAPIISESFEGTNGVGWASGTLVTNLPTSAWSSTGGDLSVITNMGDYGYTATSLPLTSDTHTNVVQLATEGGMLSFTNGALNNFWVEDGGTVYVDAMVKFVLSDGAPAESSIPSDTKIAIFANSSSNLVIRHGVAAGVTNSVTTTVIDPASWYRLTVDMIANEASGGYVRAQVRVNSNIVTHANADGDTLFRSALASGDDPDTILTAVSFQGSGFIDDVVVTRDPPTFVETASVFSYVIAESTNSVFVAYITVTSPSAWTNTYAAARSTWYTNKLGTSAEVFTLGADNRTVTAPVPDGNQSPTNILNVLLDQAKEAGELPEQFVGMSPADIAWIRTFGMTPGDTLDTDANDLAFEQAMKLNPYVNEAVTAQITSFTVGDPNSTIIVKALTNGVPYEADDLSVRILTDAKMNLADAWTFGVATNDVTGFDSNGEATAPVATPAGNFFEVRLVEKP
jgi:hypothetical protein